MLTFYHSYRFNLIEFQVIYQTVRKYIKINEFIEIENKKCNDIYFRRSISEGIRSRFIKTESICALFDC